MKLARMVFGVAVAACLLAASSRASAAEVDWSNIREEPAPREGVEIAPLLGWATSSLGPGAGIRAGYTFKEGVYAGVGFMAHYGLDALPGDATMRVGILYPSTEIGYDLRYESVSFRPYLGGGLGWFHAVTNEGSTTSSAYFLTYPGVAITYRPAHTPLFGGVDTRLLLPYVEGAKLSDTLSFGAYAVAGVHF
jgi:hypothetical protein